MRARAPLTAALLTTVLLATAPALATAPRHRPDVSGGPAPRVDRTHVSQSANARQHHPVDSSDGQRGWIAPAVPSYSRTPVTDAIARRQVAPGVTYTRWDQHDARGPIRAHLLTVDLHQPGVSLDVATSGKVRETDTVRNMVAQTHALAGVNGDFYDIGDTGAPLGVARDRAHGLLNARATGWNSAFYLTRNGRAEMDTLPLRASVAEHPGLTLTNLNSPFVQPGGIGIYTHRWGSTAGYRVTDGQHRHVRMVVVRDGRVRASTTRLTSGRPIEGTVLIGRGEGARALRAALTVGSRATVRWGLPDRPRLALTGSRFLVDDGLVNVTDDRVMAPRTAVGIDRDTDEVLILAVDGRQSTSRGYTMVELADQMVDLGADEALNLDGGGSTTMVVRGSAGKDRVVNSPSDGFQRHVANSLAVHYTAPK